MVYFIRWFGKKTWLRFEKKLCFYQVHIAVQSLKLRIKTLKNGTNWKLCSPESSLSLINEIFFHGKIKRKNRYFCKHMIFTIALIGIEEFFRGEKPLINMNTILFTHAVIASSDKRSPQFNFNFFCNHAEWKWFPQHWNTQTKFNLLL